jgi:hypothetical protein
MRQRGASDISGGGRGTHVRCLRKSHGLRPRRCVAQQPREQRRAMAPPEGIIARRGLGGRAAHPVCTGVTVTHPALRTCPFDRALRARALHVSSSDACARSLCRRSDGCNARTQRSISSSPPPAEHHRESAAHAWRHVASACWSNAASTWSKLQRVLPCEDYTGNMLCD